MDIKQTIDFIHTRGKFGINLGLERITQLLAELDNPQEHLTFIHVAGTNGKGSVCAMVSAILTKAGISNGLYTSPALTCFNERILLNRNPISDDDLVAITTKVKTASDAMVAKGFDPPSGFELETAMAILYFFESNVSIAILEVGMGGRLDATNCIPAPLISVIMKISLDHTDYLGTTISAIAGEKAAIIKPGTQVIMAPQISEAANVIRKYANRINAPLIAVDNQDIKIINTSLTGQQLQITSPKGIAGVHKVTLSLLGNHQQSNCLTALTVIDHLQNAGYDIPSMAISTALETLTFPGRFEILSQQPMFIIDGAHNPDGIIALANSLRIYFPGKPIRLFFGMLADKDVDTALDELLPLADAIYTLSPESERAMAADEMANHIAQHGYQSTPLYDLTSMIELIHQEHSDIINICTGSLYLIGHVRSTWLNSID